MSFFHGNLALVLGIVALVLTAIVRRFAKEERLREDVFGALVWFSLYVAVRSVMLGLEPSLPKEWHPYVRAIWMLAFAFGVRSSRSITSSIQSSLCRNPK